VRAWWGRGGEGLWDREGEGEEGIRIYRTLDGLQGRVGGY
jgi:hypothetical protein